MRVLWRSLHACFRRRRAPLLTGDCVSVFRAGLLGYACRHRKLQVVVAGQHVPEALHGIAVPLDDASQLSVLYWHTSAEGCVAVPACWAQLSRTALLTGRRALMPGT